MAQRISLLLVDDDVVFLDVLHCWFTRQGYDVSALLDPRDIENVVRDGPIDVAVVDLEFPAGGGMQLVQRLHNNSDENSGDPYVIVLSGHSDAPSIAKARQLGAGQYLVKPCTLKQIETAVKSAVAARDSVCAPAMVETS